MLEEKYFAPLRILYLFIKSPVNPFVDINSTFFDSSFNSFLASACFVLFEVPFLFIFLVYHQNLSFLRNQQYHFCLLNVLVLMLQQNFLTLTY